jgi:hypothetical protein
MLHRLLFEPYASEAAEARAEALQHSLAAVEDGVLLLNLWLEDELLDAVLLLPRGVALLQLLPGGRQLSTPDLARGPWLLDGQPLPGFAGTDNPYQQLQRQRAALAAWLATQPQLPALAAEDIVCLAVFSGEILFSADLERQLHQLPEQERFQLVRQPALVLRELAQLAPARPLPTATLDVWAAALLQDENDTLAPDELTAENEENDFLSRKARQLWRWLGAEDVPADPPYSPGSAPVQPDPVAAGQQEKLRLEHIRQQIRTEVSEQTQALQTREAARDQTIAQLRQQLAAASAAAPETARLEARLATEAREKAALEEAIRAARAESDARNRDLDARIQQLSLQLQQLQARPTPTSAPTAPAGPLPTLSAPTASSPARVAAPTVRPADRRPTPQRQPTASTTWRLQWPRVVLAGAVTLLAGAGIWGAVQLPGLLRKPAPNVREARPSPNGNEEAAAPTLFDIQPDTIRLTPAETATADSVIEAEELAQLADDSLVTPASTDEILDSVEVPSDDI